jgi:hypothetical protein
MGYDILGMSTKHVRGLSTCYPLSTEVEQLLCWQTDSL